MAANAHPYSPHLLQMASPPTNHQPPMQTLSGALAALSGSLSKGGASRLPSEEVSPPWDFYQGWGQLQAYLRPGPP